MSAFNEPVAHCHQGTMVGIRRSGVSVFFDIPYAELDGETGRFQPASAPSPWVGVRSAREPGVVFPQLPSRLRFVMGEGDALTVSEDAFRLNIFTAATDARAPVFVWIHGGGWLTGGAGLSWYQADELVRDGRLVVVTVNYRLGVLGNLRVPGLSQGNLSLTDLKAALEWVKLNISNFGGDPNSVTVGGQSAGAWNTKLLASNPSTAALFHRAILMSCRGVTPPDPETSERLGSDFVAHLGRDGKTDSLLTISADRLIRETQTFMARQSIPMAGFPTFFLPVSLEEGDGIDAFRGKPILVGSTREETASFFVANPRVQQATRDEAYVWFEKFHGDRAPEEYDRLEAKRCNATPYTQIIDVQSDRLFRQPAIAMAREVARNGGNAFLYDFNFQSRQPHMFAGHCFDLPFLFGNFNQWEAAPMMQQLDMKAAQSLSRKMRLAFTRFIECGDPSGSDIPHWAALSAPRSEAMRFDRMMESVAV
ncbi:carboxylesterase family protein [Paraburkholderia caledonica]|uniref:Carboxylic ester hydrolase n=1 Tax=Paraburkholderia caledonica TaxID=134536 RepID=A0AB73IL38_9BURK|nr:para-nitrobenzyl esterase [Paraburkholderia caledonica]